MSKGKESCARCGEIKDNHISLIGTMHGNRKAVPILLCPYDQFLPMGEEGEDASEEKYWLKFLSNDTYTWWWAGRDYGTSLFNGWPKGSNAVCTFPLSEIEDVKKALLERFPNIDAFEIERCP